MTKPSNLFEEKVKAHIGSSQMRAVLKNNLEAYKKNHLQAKEIYAQEDVARKRAANFRNKAIEYLDNGLIDFETTFIKRGGKVLWAVDEKQACQEIYKIIEKEKASLVVKSKSSVCEEIELKSFLKEKSVEVIESDLGDYIMQLANEDPVHFIMPAIHKSFEEIQQLFPGLTTAEQINEEVKKKIRKKLADAKICITGANFLLADIGGIAITENEGNALACASNSKIHIVVTSVDKLINNSAELDIFWPMLAVYGTGQSITAYNTILTGPRQPDELQGPDEMYVVLIDNGRSHLLENHDVRKAALCIKCGACMNQDEIYTIIGGESYQSTYKGTIGTIVNQHLHDEEEYSDQSYLSPLDGKMNTICPVHLDFNKLLLYNRRDIVRKGLVGKSYGIALFFWKNAVLKRSNMEKGGTKFKNFMFRQFFKKQWGEHRELPKIAHESFNDRWRKGEGK